MCIASRNETLSLLLLAAGAATAQAVPPMAGGGQSPTSGPVAARTAATETNPQMGGRSAAAMAFDYIGPNNTMTSGTFFFTSQENSSHPDAGYYITAQPWTPAERQIVGEVWGVFSGESMDLTQADGWRVGIWDSLAAFIDAPQAGNVLDVTLATPDLGDPAIPFGETIGGYDTFLIGFSLPSIVLQPGPEYYVGLYALNPYPANGFGGLVESVFEGLSGVQANSDAPGQYLRTVDTAFARHFGTLAYRLVASPDCNANGLPDEEETASATLTSARSRKFHGGPINANQDIGINLAGRVEQGNVTSESRLGGITELRLAFDMPPQGPCPPGPSAVRILEQACLNCPCSASATQAAYAPSGLAPTTVSIAGNELVLTFAPGLPTTRTYKVELGPGATSLAGQSVEIRSLLGDITGDGAANSNDRSAVIGAWTGPRYSIASDLNLSGTTNAIVRSLVVGQWTSPSRCAP